MKNPLQKVINKVCIAWAGTVLLFSTANTSIGTVVPATVSFSLTNPGLVLNPAFCGLSYAPMNLPGKCYEALSRHSIFVENFACDYF